MKHLDTHFIKSCIALSQESLDNGDAPFGAMVVRDGIIIAQSGNYAQKRISDHAEVIALHLAHDALSTSNLSGCVLYSNCEPCPMCSFMAREYKVSRVVYSMPSPFMGGHSKWNILEDQELENFPPFFAAMPEVVGGVLEKEAKLVFDQTPMWMFGSDPKP
jgi:tRNA(adenine34) deaminase